MNRKYPPITSASSSTLVRKARTTGTIHGLPWLRRSGRTCGAGLILGCTFCLHLLGNEAAIGLYLPLDESLRAILKGVWQRIAADVAHWQSLALLLEHKIDLPVAVGNGTRADVPANPHTLVKRRPLQRGK